MTRVVFVINDLRRAGAETQLAYLATGLDRGRFQPQVVILKSRNDFEQELREAAVPVMALGRRSPWDAHLLWRLRRALRAARPDIVHSYLSFANLLTALVAPPAALVLSQRSSYEATLSPFWRRAARWSHRRASHVIVNSKAARDEEVAAGFPAQRMTYVPNGVPTQERLPDVDRQRLGLPEGPLVVCVAQFASEKGHADLLEAWPLVRASCPGSTLALVGDGPLRAEVEARAARLGLADSVLFLGFRQPTRPYLAAADVVVLPSRTEGMPNAVLEAMALGKPIVATAVGGVPELIQDGATGLLCAPARPPSLASALIRALESPALRARLGAAARARVATSFSVARMVAATESVYAAASGIRA